jgi:hypothetical protein
MISYHKIDKRKRQNDYFNDCWFLISIDVERKEREKYHILTGEILLSKTK